MGPGHSNCLVIMHINEIPVRIITRCSMCWAKKIWRVGKYLIMERKETVFTQIELVGLIRKSYDSSLLHINELSYTKRTTIINSIISCVIIIL